MLAERHAVKLVTQNPRLKNWEEGQKWKFSQFFDKLSEYKLNPLHDCYKILRDCGALTHIHTFNGPFPGLPRWAGTRKVKPIWILLKQETVSGSGLSRAVCKSAPRSRQITMPAPHYSVFLQAWCPSCRPTNQSTEGRGTQLINKTWGDSLEILDMWGFKWRRSGDSSLKSGPELTRCMVLSQQQQSFLFVSQFVCRSSSWLVNFVETNSHKKR